MCIFIASRSSGTEKNIKSEGQQYMMYQLQTESLVVKTMLA
jgi:hypothetical protein